MLTMAPESSLSIVQSIDKNQEHSLKVLQLMNEHRKENMKLCDAHLQVGDKEFPHTSLYLGCMQPVLFGNV